MSAWRRGDGESCGEDTDDDVETEPLHIPNERVDEETEDEKNGGYRDRRSESDVGRHCNKCG